MQYKASIVQSKIKLLQIIPLEQKIASNKDVMKESHSMNLDKHLECLY